MKIYIPSIDFENTNRRGLFILTRPFWSDSSWINSDIGKERWEIPLTTYFTDDVAFADVYLIPKPINTYTSAELKEINSTCLKYKIKGFGYISGDFGIDFGHFDALFFLRMGGFKAQLSKNNKGFPVSLSDHFERIYNKKDIVLREKAAVPVVGFCGHAHLGFAKKMKEKLKFLRENMQRFFKNPFRTDYETLFSSANERALVLNSFKQSTTIVTNFIYRKHYRGGAVNQEMREQTTLEYYNNIKNSDYVVCVRGAGNFSVRLYETLMMGRIPIFVNTDCLLPFENRIDWRKHVVWVEWNNRKNIAQIVTDFHTQLSFEEFVHLQVQNRKLWKEILSVKGMLELISNDI
jgi:hypothetical protein